MSGPLPSDDYQARVTAAEKIIAESARVYAETPEAVTISKMDQIRAAARETRQELLERSEAMGTPHTVHFGNDERKMSLLLAGVLGTRRCRHFDKTPAIPSLLVMSTRTQLCHPCADRARRTPWRRPPVVVADHVCDLCLGHPVREFMSITVQLGPVLMVGDICASCMERLEGS